VSKKIRVAILFGGRSGEHEVSLVSAMGVMKAIPKDKYEVVPIGIDKNGRWLTTGDPMKLLTEGQPVLPVATREEGPSSEALVPARRELVPGTQKSGFPAVDVVFPVLHGPYGEDGTVQGLLELADLPYVGCGVAASAAGMDKALMKALFRAAGLPVVQHLVVLRKTWACAPETVWRQVEDEIGYPCFVKPANLGSSVGVAKARTRFELISALDEAARYDRKMLVEKAVDAREIECSVLGNDEPIASVPGEIVPCNEFYDYAAKYIDDRSELLIPAPISPELTTQVQEMSLRAFKALDCAGMARVDFLLDRHTEVLYVSEINTIPGFTPISMYPRLWEASGISYSDLIDRLIQLALERYEDKRRSETSYAHSSSPISNPPRQI